ncbi:hypothetical protein HGB13_01935 [bacterium]|nr:hypothetical protein [bacterium]
MENEKNIYIVLTQTGTVLSSLIKSNTGEPYNHVSIGFDKDLKEMYSFGRYFPSNPFFAGFIKENAKEGLYKIKINTECCIYKVDVTDESHLKLNNFIEEYKKNSRKHTFSLLGMIFVAFNRPFRRKYKRFCAEFVSEALYVSGIHDIGKHHSLARPHDFHFIKNSEKIFEGLLKDYK